MPGTPDQKEIAQGKPVENTNSYKAREHSRRAVLRATLFGGLGTLTSGVLGACSRSPEVTSQPQPATAPSTGTPEATLFQNPRGTATIVSRPKIATIIPTATLNPPEALTPTPEYVQGLTHLQEVPKPNEALKKTTIDMYAKTMEIDAKEVEVGISFSELKDENGDYFVTAVTLDETPLLIYHPMKNTWVEAGPRNLADLQNFTIQVPSRVDYLSLRNVPNIEKTANQLFSASELNTSVVFRNFETGDWRKIIDTWTTIKSDLDQGIIPEGFNFNWNDANKFVDFATSHQMKVRALHLLWGGDVPDSIYNGDFSPKDVEKIVEFTVKARVLRYNGTVDGRTISEWHAADEIAATHLYHHNDKWSFWLEKLGYPQATIKVAKWAKEANPNASLVIAEDSILHLRQDRANWKSNFFNLLKFIKDREVPITKVDVENNLWIYDPPKLDEMISILRRIQAMGFEIGGSEATVATSDTSPDWVYQDKMRDVKDKTIAQADVYGDILSAYLAVGAKEWGFGSPSDRTEYFDDIGYPDANSTIFDDQELPKKSYYRILKVLYQNLKSSQG